MNTYRHGDVLLKGISALPKKLHKREDAVLAYGKVTGHKHVLDNLTAEVYEDINGKVYAKVVEATPLVHEEHKTITVVPGIYEITIEREYDYALESMRTVID